MNTVQAIAIVVLKEMIRRKDFYVLFVITAIITLISGSISIFNDQGIAGYLKELALLLIWVCSLVIAVTTTARQIYAEKENRTIFPLLAKPVTRAQLLLGKFFGCWVASGISLLLFYLFLGLVAASREHSLDIGHYLVAFLLHWGSLAVVVAMALLGSIVFAAPSSNNTICLIVAVAILALERHLNTVAMQIGGVVGSMAYAIYFLLPRIDWAFDARQFLIFHDAMPAPVVWLTALAYYAGYSALLLLGAWLLFRRRALTT